MASKRDIVLAKRLLAAGVLSEDQIRQALALQDQWRQQGRRFTLDQVFYAAGLLPNESLAAALGPSPLQAQPFTNYAIEEFLGEGGLATVYRGTYTPNGTPVAIKVLDPVKALRDLHRQRFEHEARLHIELEHENVVAGYELGFEGGFHFYTMDFIGGVSLLDVIERRGHLTNEEALSITLQTARALAYLHDRGLIHRDIKPGNIMVEEDGTAYVLDLGLVGRMPKEGEVLPTDNVTTVGTVEYLSPEQARGRSDLDQRADIYSLGMTLYHMVVGEVAFQGESDYEVMAQQILSSMDTQKIKTRRIDPEIHFLITKMAAKDRDERWSSVEEAIAMIEGYLPQGIVPVDFGEAPPVAPPIEPGGTPPVARPVKPPSAPPGEPSPPDGPGKGQAPRRTRPAGPTRKRRRFR